MEIKKIKLNKLADNSLAQREMKGIKGGACCSCGCFYANQGGSSTQDNGVANAKHCYSSPIPPGRGDTPIELDEVIVIGRRRN